MAEGAARDGTLHTLPSVSSTLEAASASGTCALDARDTAQEVRPDMMYSSWHSAPDYVQQLPSSSAMTEAGDHQDDDIKRMPLACLPVLEQHQIRLEDGSIRTYYALSRKSVMDSLPQEAGYGKLPPTYYSLAFPQLNHEEGNLFSAPNLREQCIEDVLEPHSERREATCTLDLVPRKHGSLHTEDDLYETRRTGLETADHTPFKRRVRRELEDLSHLIEDGNWACNPHDLSLQPGNEHARIEEFSEHVHRAFMNYAKVLNEFPEERTKLERQGKGGTLLCLACKRFSKPYLDTQSLVMHTFMSGKRGLRAEHLGLRKAICTLMGWSTTLEPTIWKGYQHITLEEAKMNREDLILWPPAVVIHNALAMESSNFQARGAAGLAVKDLFKDAGLSSLGIEVVVGDAGSLLVEYNASSACLLEAEQLHLHLATKGCGRDAWLQKSAAGQQESTVRDKRILYGYLACAHDLDLADRDFRRRCVVLSRKKVLAVGIV